MGLPEKVRQVIHPKPPDKITFSEPVRKKESFQP